MIKVAVAGVTGRMGSRILSLLIDDIDCEVVGATEYKGHPSIGKDAGLAANIGDLRIPISGNMEEAAKQADVIVDFTLPEATIEHARFASKSGKAMVIGTTGFSNDEKTALLSLTSEFPCILAPNMSIGVNVMFEVAKRLASLLGDEYDVEIVEAHHKHKVDAPSGTALKLAEVIAHSLGRDLDEVGRYERYGKIGERPEAEIGIQTLRGGDVVGEHTAFFFGHGERIELTHRATNRDNFARGAIRAVKWIAGKSPGLYDMNDVLGIK